MRTWRFVALAAGLAAVPASAAVEVIGIQTTSWSIAGSWSFSDGLQVAIEAPDRRTITQTPSGRTSVFTGSRVYSGRTQFSPLPRLLTLEWLASGQALTINGTQAIFGDAFRSEQFYTLAPTRVYFTRLFETPGVGYDFPRLDVVGEGEYDIGWDTDGLRLRDDVSLQVGARRYDNIAPNTIIYSEPGYQIIGNYQNVRTDGLVTTIETDFVRFVADDFAFRRQDEVTLNALVRFGSRDVVITRADLSPPPPLPVLPEPATWALMVGGFGLTGVTIRRWRKAGGDVTA